MRSHRTAFSLLALALALLAGAICDATAATASGMGELTRFGERAEQGRSTPTPKGFLAGSTAQASEEIEVNYALGVDPAERNAVFVLDEPLEAENVGTKHHDEYTSWERHLRIQRFEPSTGKATAEATFVVTSPFTENSAGAIEEEYVSNIAVDPEKGLLYVLVTEPREYDWKIDAEAPAAYELLAFKTSNLEPAGTDGAVLASPEQLSFASKGKKGEALPLLLPRGIAVDPTNHEVVLEGYEDASGEEVDRLSNNRAAFERVSSAGDVGARWVDSANWFGAHAHGTEPDSPVVTKAGKVLVHFEGLAEIPADFASGGSPVQLQGKLPPEKTTSFIEETGAESESGGSLSIAPEEHESQRLYEPAQIAKEKVLAVDAREISKDQDGSFVGWTGGQSPVASLHDECVLQPGPAQEPLDIAAGGEGKLFVLAPEYLKAPGDGYQPATDKAVIELGPGGSGCPPAKGSAVTVLVNQLALSEGQPVEDKKPIGFSLELTEADALSAEWTIENKKTKSKKVLNEDPLEFRKEQTTEYALWQEPLTEYSFPEPGEYLVSARIGTDDLATPTLETPARPLVVDAAPVVTEQPVSQTDPEGGSATFSAEASGAPTPAVVWEVSKNSGANWEELKGEDSTVLVLKDLTSAQSGYEYRARFVNTIGKLTREAESDPANLTVSDAEAPPVVTLPPKNQSVIVGQTATFVGAASGVPAPTVQWEVLKSSGGKWEEVPGATSSELKVASATSAENGWQYRASFKNKKGEATSKDATLTVSEPVKEKPEGVISPKTQEVKEGESATFTLTVTKGNPAPSIQWEARTGASWHVLTGQSKTTLTIAGAVPAEEGEYRAVLKNEEGESPTEPAVLKVRAKEAQHQKPPEEEHHSTTTTATTTENPPPPPPEPVATLAGASTTVASSGAFSIKISCTVAGTHCSGKVVVKTLTAVAVGAAKKGKKPKKEILVLAGGAFGINGAASGVVSLHLSSQGRSLLAHSHTLKVKALVEVSGGHTVGETLTLRLAAPKMKKKK